MVFLDHQLRNGPITKPVPVSSSVKVIIKPTVLLWALNWDIYLKPTHSFLSLKCPVFSICKSLFIKTLFKCHLLCEAYLSCLLASDDPGSGPAQHIVPTWWCFFPCFVNVSQAVYWVNLEGITASHSFQDADFQLFSISGIKMHLYYNSQCFVLSWWVQKGGEPGESNGVTVIYGIDLINFCICLCVPRHWAR